MEQSSGSYGNRSQPMSNLPREDFFSTYLAYVSGTEVPINFHRWSAIASIGALLGRKAYFRFGHSNIYPNIYCMLIGNAGSRKSSAIKLAKKLITQSGYTSVAVAKTTKEKFLLDLSGIEKADTNEDFLDQAIFGGTANDIAETFIMADEFNDFFGNNNLEFISLLGSLWDHEGPYENRIKNGKSFVINNPTISILGGNTPTTFASTFPPEIIGQGFFSRLLLIYGESNGIKITFPADPDPAATEKILAYMHKIRSSYGGPIPATPAARDIIDKIYHSYVGMDDIRFESYSSRRLTHLIKLCIIHAAAALHDSIEAEDVVMANTILTHAEYMMPKALGEFGKALNSDVAHKIMQIIDKALVPITMMDIWKEVSTDLNKIKDLGDILQNLQAASKIQNIGGKGFLPKKKIQEEVMNGILDWNYLTQVERKM